MNETLIKIQNVDLYFKKQKKIMKSSVMGFKALDNINLEINRGDKVGILGKNGSGKSTLLSLIAGIYSPDFGKVINNADSTCLLSVNAGYFPYLSGRKNIYLHGLLLGMDKKQVSTLMSEIINFSGLEEFIDEPVETYSSGMKSRLGIAAAVYITPELLLIDETLSVGDAEFKEKSRYTLTEKLKNTTSILASHNLNDLTDYCNKTIVINKGHCLFFGDTLEAIERYNSILKE